MQKLKNLYQKIEVKFETHRRFIFESLALMGFIFSINCTALIFYLLITVHKGLPPTALKIYKHLDRRYERVADQKNISPEEFIKTNKKRNER